MPDNKTVIIVVHCGCATPEFFPPDITVIIRDYDIDGVDEDRLLKDAEGDPIPSMYILMKLDFILANSSRISKLYNTIG